MLPMVTIVIPFYNCPYVDQAIESALNQSYPNFEIIVVDDGSTIHADKIYPYFSRIHYLAKANGGTASALNHGIRMASGEYIAWLSSDDCLYSCKLNNQIYYMLDNNAEISFTSFDVIDSNSCITQQSVSLNVSNVIDFYRSFFTYNPINGSTVMVKKQLFSRVGLFDEALPFTHDLDLWFRAMLTGNEFHYLDQPLTAYRWHDQMGTIQNRSAVNFEHATTNSRFLPQMAQFIDRLQKLGQI